MLCDFDLFQICFPYEFNSWCKWISDFFKFTRVREIQDIDTFNSAWDVLNKTDFLITVFHNRGLERYNIFFGNSNRDWERGMIQREAPVWMCQDRWRWTLFHFPFSFYFIFLVFFSFIFLFLEQLGLGAISHAVTSVTTWWRSHKTDHETWENLVEDSRTNDVIQHGHHMLTLWTTHGCLG